MCENEFLFIAPPQFSCQAPPGAQQLARPDLANVPHFGHATLAIIVGMTDEKPSVVTGVRTISSRSGNGCRVPCVLAGVESAVHATGDIDPNEPSSILLLSAFE